MRLGADPQTKDLLRSPEFRAFSAAIADLKALENETDPQACFNARAKLQQAEKAFLSVAHTVPQALIRSTMTSLQAIADDLRALTPKSATLVSGNAAGDGDLGVTEALPDATTIAILQRTQAQAVVMRDLETRALADILADQNAHAGNLHVALNAIGYRLETSPTTGERTVQNRLGRVIQGDEPNKIAEQLAVAASAGVASLTALTQSVDPDVSVEYQQNILDNVAEIRSLTVLPTLADGGLTSEKFKLDVALTQMISDDMASGVLFSPFVKPILTYVDGITEHPEDRDDNLDQTIITHKKLLSGNETERTLTTEEKDYADYLVSVGQFRKEGDRYVPTMPKDEVDEALQILTRLSDPASSEGRQMRALMLEALANETFMATLKADMAELARLVAADNIAAAVHQLKVEGKPEAGPGEDAPPHGHGRAQRPRTERHRRCQARRHGRSQDPGSFQPPEGRARSATGGSHSAAPGL